MSGLPDEVRASLSKAYTDLVAAAEAVWHFVLALLPPDFWAPPEGAPLPIL